MTKFTTHLGETVEGERLTAALNQVADDWAGLARGIRTGSRYADHVSEEKKDANMNEMLEQAERIRGGEVDNFTIWQRVNTVITGECVPLFS